MTDVGIGVGAATAVFAGVFHVDGEAAKVFEKDFGGKAAMAAGAGGRNEDFALGNGPAGKQSSDVGPEFGGIEVEGQGALQGIGLLEDFAQHFVIKGRHGSVLRVRAPRGNPVSFSIIQP